MDTAKEQSSQWLAIQARPFPDKPCLSPMLMLNDEEFIVALGAPQDDVDTMEQDSWYEPIQIMKYCTRNQRWSIVFELKKHVRHMRGYKRPKGAYTTLAINKINESLHLLYIGRFELGSGNFIDVINLQTGKWLCNTALRFGHGGLDIGGFRLVAEQETNWIHRIGGVLSAHNGHDHRHGIYNTSWHTFNEDYRTKNPLFGTRKEPYGNAGGWMPTGFTAGPLVSVPSKNIILMIGGTDCDGQPMGIWKIEYVVDEQGRRRWLSESDSEHGYPVASHTKIENLNFTAECFSAVLSSDDRYVVIGGNGKLFVLDIGVEEHYRVWQSAIAPPAPSGITMCLARTTSLKNARAILAVSGWIRRLSAPMFQDHIEYVPKHPLLRPIPIVIIRTIAVYCLKDMIHWVASDDDEVRKIVDQDTMIGETHQVIPLMQIMQRAFLPTPLQPGERCRSI